MSDNVFSIKLDEVASKMALDLIEKFPEKMSKATEISLFRIGQEVRNDGGSFAPYKTGNLRRSLTNRTDKNAIFKEKKNQVEVGTNLIYARTQEYGRGNIPARRYMTKAMQKQSQGRGSKIFNEEITTVIK